MKQEPLGGGNPSVTVRSFYNWAIGWICAMGIITLFPVARFRLLGDLRDPEALEHLNVASDPLRSRPSFHAKPLMEAGGLFQLLE